MRKLAALLVLSSLSFVVRADMYEDFIVAVNNDRVPQVKELLGKGIDPNTVGPNGEPALVLAARAGYAGTVDALLAAKANVNARRWDRSCTTGCVSISAASHCWRRRCPMRW